MSHPSTANPIFGKWVIEFESQTAKRAVFSDIGNVNEGTVGWKCSRYTGMKGRQSNSHLETQLEGET